MLFPVCSVHADLGERCPVVRDVKADSIPVSAGRVLSSVVVASSLHDSIGRCRGRCPADSDIEPTGCGSSDATAAESGFVVISHSLDNSALDGVDPPLVASRPDLCSAGRQTVMFAPCSD